MSKKSIYWTCQFVGWFLLIFCDFIIYTLESGFEWEMFSLSISNILLCILLTHLYRHIIGRWNWVKLPLYRLIPRVTISGGILGLLMTVINFPIDVRIFNDVLDSQSFLFLSSWLAWTKSMLMWVLSYTMYHYFENVKTVEIEKILLQTSINDSEAKILRSQLNPHFVFNALNSIRALVSENPEKSQQSITQLSNILRNSLLADRRKTVELREEIKTVEDYLALEKVRYEERLTTDFHIDPKTLFLQVPPMMLQTLVENAIKHGVQKAIKGGFIQVTSFMEENSVHVHIRNTGTLGTAKPSSDGGFGLENTERRLTLLYGDRAKFRIFQESEDVVRADIVFPIQTQGLFTTIAIEQ